MTSQIIGGIVAGFAIAILVPIFMAGVTKLDEELQEWRRKK